MNVSPLPTIPLTAAARKIERALESEKEENESEENGTKKEESQGRDARGRATAKMRLKQSDT